MKKLILFLSLALLSTAAFAQEGLHIKVAFSMTDFMGDSSNAKAKPGFKAGFGYDYRLGEVLYLQPSLVVAAKGAQYKQELLGITASKTINSLYVELPVLLSAKIDMDIIKQRRFNIGVGPYAAYGIGGNTTYSGNWSSW